jgi:hypothetical protein
MHPKDFEDYWDMSHVELAQLLGDYTVDGVQNWFRKTDPKQVPDNVLRKLTDVHLRWSNWEQQEELLPPNDPELYRICRDRRRRRK